MKRISIKIFIMASIVTICVISMFGKSAYADWDKDGEEWKYIGDYGYEIGWQQINGKWYYFSSDTGTMKIGWLYDEQYSKWYYLNFDGSMDGSKTTSTYPIELSSIQDKINQCTGDKATYDSTKRIDDNVFECFKGNSDASSKQYYYHPSTGNIYKIENGILTNIQTHEVINFFTQEQAVQTVKDYLSKNYKDIPQIIKVENDDGDHYLVHCYDDTGDYITNSTWYSVDKTTREVKITL